MSIFTPLVSCFVYVCIVSLFTSISWARHLGSIGVGGINKEDSQHFTTFRNPSKSPEKLKVLDMTTVPLGRNASAMITQQEGRMKLKPEQGRISNANPISNLDDHRNNHEHQNLITNGMRIRARNGHGNEAKLPPFPNPSGKSSRHRAKRKRKPTQAMVSWRVPRKKKKKGEHHQQEEQPDFDLDYAPPKVHPPTHN